MLSPSTLRAHSSTRRTPPVYQYLRVPGSVPVQLHAVRAHPVPSSAQHANVHTPDGWRRNVRSLAWRPSLASRHDAVLNDWASVAMSIKPFVPILIFGPHVSFLTVCASRARPTNPSNSHFLMLHISGCSFVSKQLPSTAEVRALVAEGVCGQ